MLRASLFRLPVIITFINAATVGVLLAWLSHYYMYSVPASNLFGSYLASYRLHEHNVSSQIALQAWHSHAVVCVYQ